jgi:hypothetical protein
MGRSGLCKPYSTFRGRAVKSPGGPARQRDNRANGGCLRPAAKCAIRLAEPRSAHFCLSTPIMGFVCILGPINEPVGPFSCGRDPRSVLFRLPRNAIRLASSDSTSIDQSSGDSWPRQSLMGPFCCPRRPNGGAAGPNDGLSSSSTFTTAEGRASSVSDVIHRRSSRSHSARRSPSGTSYSMVTLARIASPQSTRGPTREG